MFSTQSEQGKTTAIAASIPVLPGDAIPCLAGRANPGIEVAREDEMVRHWYSSIHRMKVIIELVCDFVRVGHGRGICTYDSGTLLAKQGELEHHQLVIHSLVQVDQLLNKVVLCSKADTCFLFGFTAMTALEEYVTTFSFCELSFVG